MGTLALLSEALCEQQECNETKEAELPAAFQKPDPLITASGLCVCVNSLPSMPVSVLKFALLLI